MMTDEQLAEIVQNYEELYNMRHPGYKNIDAKAEIWAEIGSHLGVSGEECAIRWKKLRERFTKELKIHMNAPSGSVQNLIPPRWHMFGALMFLKPHIAVRHSRFNSTQMEETTAICKQSPAATTLSTQTAIRRSKRPRSADSTDEAITTAANAITESSREQTTVDAATRHFAEFMALELSSMSIKMRREKMRRIMTILTEPTEDPLA